MLTRPAVAAMRKFAEWLRRTFWRHRWVYPTNGNPYRRTCSVCGKHEQFMAWRGYPDTGWWETWDDGTPAKHYESVL